MSEELFDRKRRRMVRERAAALGPELVLLDRAFDDCLERIAAIRRPFEHALLIGAASPKWAKCLAEFAARVDVVDPGPRFARSSAGAVADEDRHDFGDGRYDLVVTLGTLDSVNDLPVALQLIRRSMRPDSPLIGAISGGDTLPMLRAAMLEADRLKGIAAARTHPRIDGPTLAALLGAAGFSMPVVDVDRVALRYRRLADLVRDLRAMGGSSTIARRGPSLGKSGYEAASRAFAALGDGDRTAERFELIHFLAWSDKVGNETLNPFSTSNS